MSDALSERLPLELIVAVGRGGLIGSSSGKLGLPWHIPEDLKHFKRITLGRPILMGRTTFEAIGRPLPKRRNLVLSKSLRKLEGVEVFASLESALHAAREGHEVPVVIGGARVYAETLPLITRIHWTDIDREAVGDVFFPPLGDDFVEVERREGESEGVTFRVLERR
ncbi:MAG: dihydrofolate reductase [Myxococcota bacterium]